MYKFEYTTGKLNLICSTCIPALASKTPGHGLLLHQHTQCLCELDVCSNSISVFIILPHITSRQALLLTKRTLPHYIHTRAPMKATKTNAGTFALLTRQCFRGRSRPNEETWKQHKYGNAKLP